MDFTEVPDRNTVSSCLLPNCIRPLKFRWFMCSLIRSWPRSTTSPKHPHFQFSFIFCSSLIRSDRECNLTSWRPHSDPSEWRRFYWLFYTWSPRRCSDMLSSTICNFSEQICLYKLFPHAAVLSFKVVLLKDGNCHGKWARCTDAEIKGKGQTNVIWGRAVRL